VFVDDFIEELVQQIVSESDDFADDRVACRIDQGDILFHTVGFFSGLRGGIDSDEFIILVKELNILEDLDIVVVNKVAILKQMAHGFIVFSGETIDFEIDANVKSLNKADAG
jgi:hypothetical protein